MKPSTISSRSIVCLAAICWIGGFYFGRAITRQAHQKGIAAGLGVSKWDKTCPLIIIPTGSSMEFYTNRMFTNWTLVVAKP